MIGVISLFKCIWVIIDIYIDVAINVQLLK